jgi:diguanylate cyclase (GGDEF)-like protein
MLRRWSFPRPRRLLRARAIALSLVLATLGWSIETAFQPLSILDAGVQDIALANRSPDRYLGAAANTSADPRQFITIVAIDERTLAELGAYNGGYPRAYQAQLIDHLLAAPPRVIAFDIGFFEPTPGDDELTAALDRARSMPVPTNVILSSAALNASDTAAGDSPAFASALEPVPQLASRAGLALANVIPDSRGTVRRAPLVANVDGITRPTLGLAAVAAYLRRPNFMDARSPGALQLAGRTIPLDADGSLLINFFGPPSRPYAAGSTFRVVSFVDVLRGRVDPSVWRGGLVFVGTLGATGLADDYWTPTSDDGRKMAGLEIHANVAATLFSGSYLRSLPDAGQFGLFIAVAVLMLLVATLVSPIVALAVGPLVLGLVAVAEVGALYWFGELMPLAMPSVVGVCVLACIAGARLVREQRQARAARAELAVERTRDRVTGLANRRELLAEMRGMPREPFTLLVLDLDRFKDINDALGHTAGDRLLRILARRLAEALAGTRAHIARLDGDEFAIVLPDVLAEQATATTCVHLLAALELPVELEGQSIAVSGSIGLAEFPKHGADPETLLRHADAAVDAAKQLRSGHAIYAPELEHRTAERLELVAALRRALAEDEFQLHYQPKVDCRSGEIRGVEALVRWMHPTLGLIGPDRFIPMAEETGLISAVTRWVLEVAVGQARAWGRAGHGLRIAVNLSACDLQEPSTSAYVRDLLERYAVAPTLLSLEITETAVMADPARALRTLNELAEYGVDASLDDFGTGYSSLSYLRQLPLRELKIDASFVRGLTEVERDQAIVSSTIELGHRLGMRVVAEGVEDARTLDLLADLGCDEAQGFYLSRPLAAEALEIWLRSRAPLESERAAA